MYGKSVLNSFWIIERGRCINDYGQDCQKKNYNHLQDQYPLLEPMHNQAQTTHSLSIHFV
ncbi:hypothetical protein BpHYR1_016410 [Brachionus plicatilis]|uniref:Uncharacterized protein n=1 Tax=Brachionus plicatilis TaxID=10195 RepID=A0A3M7T297_BRAPC|nr:hypothetical protein BpHYR1_016410 [Brachionus plicatilis]